MQIRELTAKEKRDIRRFIKTTCANYDNEHGCLLLDGDCYMFYGVAFTNSALCKWFRNALMPQNAEIERLFIGGTMSETKPCVLCGKEFPINGRQTYCSNKCAKEGRRKSVANNVKKYKKAKRNNQFAR